MRLIWKILAILMPTLLVPLGVLASLSVRSMERIRRDASFETARALTASETDRLLQLTREEAQRIDALLELVADDVIDLRSVTESMIQEGAQVESPPPSYEGRDTAGLPGYGYVDPRWGAYADFERRGAAAPWLPRPVVARVRADPALRAELTRLLPPLIRATRALVRSAEKRRSLVDLAWIVLEVGLTNAYPPYDYVRILERDPAIADVAEGDEDYVRLANPEHNPDRRTLWLEPYFDPFKKLWMTSCVAPLYHGEQFLGATGMDILLPTVTETVVRMKPGRTGYAFLLSSSGRVIALPEVGIRDLIGDERQRTALHELAAPPDRQRWEGGLLGALEGAGLDRSSDPVIRDVAGAMRRGETGVRLTPLGGRLTLLAYAPVETARWSLGVVIDVEEALAPVNKLQETLRTGARGIARDQLLYAILIVVAAVALGLTLYSQAIRPLGRFTREVQRLDWHNLDPPPAPARRDEIGELWRRFHEMVAAIRAARDENEQKTREVHEANERLREANRALSREKELVAVTLWSIGDGVIAVDPGGHVVTMNRVAEQLLGRGLDEARGRALGDVLHLLDAQTRAPVEDPVGRALAAGPGGAEHHLLVTDDGIERRVAESAAPIRDLEGRVFGVVLVLRDVTERSRLEEEMGRIGKLESVAVLAAGIAHDFNNLLAAILMNVSVARRRVGTEAANLALGDAEAAALRARDLTAQLLTFARGGAPVRAAVALPALVREAAGFALRGSGVRLELAASADLWPVHADAGQISQVVHNLALNASQAMRSSGTLRVVARNVEIAADGRPPLAPGRYVEVTVRDEGEGIPPDVLPRIFDPFFTTKPRGSGLGLAVCFSILQRHGGHIDAESTVGRGATFRCWLPASAEAPSDEGEGARRPESGAGRILVMDDDPHVRRAIATMLGGLGYEVSVAADGAEARTLVERAHAAGDAFAALVLDLTVPGGIGGAAALRMIRELDPEVPAIVSSGYSDDPILADPEAYGFAGVLAKPYRVEDAAALLARLIRRSG